MRIKNYCGFLLLSLALFQQFFVPSLAQLSESTKRKIDSALTAACDKNSPGLVLALLNKNQIIYQKAAGLSDLKTKTPLSTDTVFDLASCSKFFTAVSILMLADRGKLSLSDDAAKYLPEFGKEAQFTIADMLQMTSGLPEYTDSWDDENAKNADVAKVVAKQERNFRAGKKFEYCNTNYVLLALIVARVSGLQFDEFLQKEIFSPLAMKHTVLLTNSKQVVPNRAGGYKKDGHNYVSSRDDSSIVGDGQIMTTVGDLALWFDAIDQNKLVKAQTMKNAYKSGQLLNREKTGYGFGWFLLTDDDGHLLCNHSGSWSGTATFIERDLTDNWTIIVLSNDDAFPVSDFANKIVQLVDDQN